MNGVNIRDTKYTQDECILDQQQLNQLQKQVTN